MVLSSYAGTCGGRRRSLLLRSDLSSARQGYTLLISIVFFNRFTPVTSLYLGAVIGILLIRVVYTPYWLGLGLVPSMVKNTIIMLDNPQFDRRFSSIFAMQRDPGCELLSATVLGGRARVVRGQ